MSYSGDRIIAALRQARLEKGLSQRDLSRVAGVPQSHISRIEQGGVDLQLSSLLDLARALDLELMTVPRKLVPAVEAISRKASPAAIGSDDERKQYLREVQRLKRLVRRLSASTRTQNLQKIASIAAELRNFPAGTTQRERIAKISDMLEAPSSSDAAKASSLREVAQELVRVRNALAHGAYEKPDRLRPAYSLKSADENA